MVAFRNFIAKSENMKQLVFLFIVFSFFFCQPRVNQLKVVDGKYSQLQKTKWLIGSWQRKSEKGILTETWHLLNDSTFTGRSFFVNNIGDTLSSETIRLEQRNGKLYYIPIVSGQNDGKAILFTQTNLSDSMVIFENPTHDFPQKIDYRFQKPDSLIAEVSASSEETKKSIVFRMRRLN